MYCIRGTSGHMASKPQPAFLSVDFFCGAGGTTRGLLDAGGYVICGIDNDPSCQATYLANNKNKTGDGQGPQYLNHDMFPATNLHSGGQQHLIMAHLLEVIPKYRFAYPDIPLIFAICAPCQSFTKFVQNTLTTERASTRKREMSLLDQAMPFVRRFNPDFILSENVANVQSGKNLEIWQAFSSSLRDASYIVGDSVVCASHFGIPQRRKRSILLAQKTSIESNSDPLRVPNLNPWTRSKTVRDAIGHFPPIKAGESNSSIPNHVCRNLSPINKLRLRALRPGQSNFALSNSNYGDLSLPCHKRLESTGQRGFGDVYTRIDPDRLAPTITTRFISVSNGRFGHYDDNQIRGLSLREGAALQGFSDKYTFKGPSTDRIARMIGNAVPPKIARFYAIWLLNRWRKERMQADSIP